MTSSFLEVPARAMGMGFAYGLGGSGRFPIQFFQIRPFLFVIFLCFGGGLEFGGIPKGANNAIHLWFAMVGVFLDRHFFRK